MSDRSSKNDICAQLREQAPLVDRMYADQLMRDAADKIERLTRELADTNAELVTQARLAIQRRTALEWYQERATVLTDYLGKKQTDAVMAVVTELSLDSGRRAHKALSGEPNSAPKRAYYETHEPPHCPTCDCGSAPETSEPLPGGVPIARYADDLYARMYRWIRSRIPHIIVGGLSIEGDSLADCTKPERCDAVVQRAMLADERAAEKANPEPISDPST